MHIFYFIFEAVLTAVDKLEQVLWTVTKVVKVGAPALSENSEGSGLGQPGEVMASGGPTSSCPAPQGRLVRRWSQTLF